MIDFINMLSELTDAMTAFRAVVSALKAEIEEIKAACQNGFVLFDAQDVMEKTGWSLKTTQKAMRDPRMKTIWLGKGPQVTPKELERYCALNIDRRTDRYWKED